MSNRDCIGSIVGVGVDIAPVATGCGFNCRKRDGS